MTPRQKPLGQRLLDAGLVSSLQLDLALREQKRKGRMLGEVLIDLGFVNADVLTGTLASENNAIGGHVYFTGCNRGSCIFYNKKISYILQYT